MRSNTAGHRTHRPPRQIDCRAAAATAGRSHERGQHAYCQAGSHSGFSLLVARMETGSRHGSAPLTPDAVRGHVPATRAVSARGDVLGGGTPGSRIILDTP